MSRVAKSPVSIPATTEVSLQGNEITVKGSKGSLTQTIHTAVSVEQQDSQLQINVKKNSKSAWAMAGTMRALINNMVLGVSQGFEKKLRLEGVGYRAEGKGRVLNLTLGFSHPINFALPDGIDVETPSQTEVIVKGIDKQKVGQVAANIRSFRPPEPYKGKGIRYDDEVIVRKEAKKK